MSQSSFLPFHLLYSDCLHTLHFCQLPQSELHFFKLTNLIASKLRQIDPDFWHSFFIYFLRIQKFLKKEKVRVIRFSKLKSHFLLCWSFNLLLKMFFTRVSIPLTSRITRLCPQFFTRRTSSNLCTRFHFKRMITKRSVTDTLTNHVIFQ